MRETVEILELKIKKLEQLVKLKDAKIGNLTNKLNSVGIMWKKTIEFMFKNKKL